MKSIVLSSGLRARLYPIYKGVFKRLMQDNDKSMTYYRISVPILAGIREVLAITTRTGFLNFDNPLGYGPGFAIELRCAMQRPLTSFGRAFLISEEFIRGDVICLMSGDNMFYGYH